VFARLPAELRRACPDELSAIHAFAASVLPVLGEHAAAVKPQSACFERYGFAGVGVYEMFCAAARAVGLVVIGDVKRGDIGTTAEHYAHATLMDPPPIEGEPVAAADAVTVNSYFGVDGLRPFCDVAAARGRGVFALVRTSNPGGDAIQSLRLDDGRSVAEAVGQLVAQVGDEESYLGERGYSLLGAVVGATKPGDAARLRKIMPRQVFLVPGFGAQGGSADDVAACFNDDGAGAIITASRSVLYAYEKAGGGDWLGAIEAAAIEMKRQVAAILG
jgi:orotidine-5'-phosphate decarboxylase